MSIESEVRYFFSQMKAFENEEVIKAIAAQVYVSNNGGWEGAVILTNFRLCFVSEPGFFSEGLAAYVGWSALEQIAFENTQNLKVNIQGKAYSASCNEHVKPLINAFISDTVRYGANEDYSRGLDLFKEGKLQESLSLLLTAQRKDPRSAWIRLSLADVYWSSVNILRAFRKFVQLFLWIFLRVLESEPT